MTDGADVPPLDDPFWEVPPSGASVACTMCRVQARGSVEDMAAVYEQHVAHGVAQEAG